MLIAGSRRTRYRGSDRCQRLRGGSAHGLSTVTPPLVNYVQQEGHDLSELEFDILDVHRDVMARQLALTGSTILAVAVGFEVWSGPISHLVSEDFCVDAK